MLFRKKLIVVFLSLSFLSGAIGVAAQEATSATQPWLKGSPERMEQWKDLRFGMFIHWGPVSLKGVEIGWGRGKAFPDQKQGGRGTVPAAEYDNLYKEFNPTLFNADEWAAIAKEAGMKYMVLTTRHHDGFSMFDTKQSDYKITSPQSPFKRDVTKEYSEACRKAGLWLGYYYSPPNWQHPDYRTASHNEKFIPFLHAQLKELMSNYGKVDILWFDGLGGKAADWDAETIFKMARQLQPQLVINNRCGLPADWDTPEQKIGAFKNDRPWETCMTICHQWAWKPGDTMKSLKQCLQTLITCAGGDGNLLFNVGPMPDGRIEPRQVERLKEMGAWLKKYGEAIYGTRGGPFKPGKWGASTHKGNTIYLMAFDWGAEGALTLPAISKKITGAKTLTGGEAKVKQEDSGLTIELPAADRQEIATVITLELDGPAKDIAPVAKPGDVQTEAPRRGAQAAPKIDIEKGSLSEGKKAAASMVYQNNENFGADKAIDGNGGSRWATDSGTEKAWLEVDLGAPTEFNRVKISECVQFGQRIESFELQYKDGVAWKTIFKGDKIGANFEKKFDPVKAQSVRLNILQASDGPTVNEFQVFNDAKK
ncbi:MAG: alpha-L-fucosidase [Candidatus Sumerlaeota bacterium]|nr:alpha-L-fucosidase [Candidatus Sumerlaeota bacterium]